MLGGDYAWRHHIRRPVSEDAWAEIEALPDLGYEAIGEGWSVNLRGVSLNLDFLIERIEHLS